MNPTDFASAITEAIASLSSHTDINRPLRLRLSSRHSPIAQVLLPQQINITEGLYDGLNGHITCLSQRADLPLAQFKALPLEVQLVTDRRELRLICGLVTHARRGQSADGGTAYQLSFTDVLSVMERRINTRSFRDSSVLDITRVMLDEWLQRNPSLARAFDYLFLNLDEARYPKRAFTRQANESDRAFITRLWRESGLSWFFRPAPADAQGDDTPRQQLVLFDDAMQLPLNAAGDILYQRPGAAKQRAGITQWASATQLVPGGVARTSWDYMEARVARIELPSLLDQGECGNDMAALLQDTLIETPHAGDSNDDHQRLTRLAIQRHEFEADCSHGEGDNPEMAVCEYNPISGHPELVGLSASEREFIPIRIRHVGENNFAHELDAHCRPLIAASERLADWQAHPQRGADDAPRYQNSFIAVRRSVAITPAWNPARDFPPTPPVHAVVVGPPGEEVWCDAQGRVKIEFHGLDPRDHAHAGGAGTNMNDASSAWVQWVTLWAGRTEGLDAIPRVGMQVVVHFMAGDPSRPYIAGCVHGGQTPPVEPQHVGKLPGNRHMTTLQSREIGSTRYGGLIGIDDTPGQISIKVASEHGHSQNNQGYLTHARRDGQAEPRGEGQELRTDHSLALRSAKAMLLSTFARLNAAGHQLSCEEFIGHLSGALAQAMAQGQSAADNLAEGTDTAPQQQLRDHIENWQNGSNTAPDAPGGGQPVIGLSAAAGIAMATPESATLSAGKNLDLVAAQHIQHSAGKRYAVRAAESISLFAHRLGAKFVAAMGTLKLLALKGPIEMGASERVHVYSSGADLVLEGPQGITLRTQGAEIALKDGRITFKATGEIAGLAANFSFDPPGSVDGPNNSLAATDAQYDQQVTLRHIGTEVPMRNQRYRVKTEDGQTFEGTTDDQGLTERFSLSAPFGRYTIEPLYN